MKTVNVELLEEEEEEESYIYIYIYILKMFIEWACLDHV